jgi:hypothetical protein
VNEGGLENNIRRAAGAELYLGIISFDVCNKTAGQVMRIEWRVVMRDFGQRLLHGVGAFELILHDGISLTVRVCRCLRVPEKSE